MVSTVTPVGRVATETLPALSVDLAVNDVRPSDNGADTTKVQLPFAATVAKPALTPLAKISTVLPASVAPVRVGVVSCVMRSVALMPVSSATVVMLVPVGAVVSTRRTNPADNAEVLLAPSVAVAVRVCAPSDRIPVLAKVHAPEPSATADPKKAVPS